MKENIFQTWRWQRGLINECLLNLNYKKGKEILCGVRETFLFTFGLNAKFDLICDTKKLLGTSAFQTRMKEKVFTVFAILP